MEESPIENVNTANKILKEIQIEKRITSEKELFS